MTWEKLKPEQTRTLYETMWKDESIFAVKCLPTSKNESPSSYRFSDGNKVECCFEEVRKEHKQLTDIKKRLEVACKEEKGNYKKEYEEQKDKYDEKKDAYDEAIKELLIKQFGLKETFKDKYNMAVSGSGSESFKITKLNSSSLCCLLFFYNVSDNNPLTLELKTNRGERTVKFTRSIFEFKNKVVSGRGASNIDVVLIGKEQNKGTDGEKIILFLESKFAEYYLYSGQNTCIKKGYYREKWPYCRFYKDILKQSIKKCELTISPENEEEEDHILATKDSSVYVEGIKQMISHYIGMQNLMAGDIYKSEMQKEIFGEISKATVILGEIVFAFPDNIGKKEFDRYKEKYMQLAEILITQEGKKKDYSELAIIAEKQKQHNTKFEIMNDLLCYADLLKRPPFTVDEKVKAFYRMN